MDKIVVIPARFGSSRLEGKPLLPIGGLPMVIRVARQAQSLADQSMTVVVATDDARIKDVCIEHSVDVVMTSPNHESGTDRVVEVYERLKSRGMASESSLIVNVQGDEPLIPVEFLDGFVDHCESVAADMYTAATKISDPESLSNPNVVKVVLNNKSDALYFSRAPLCLGRQTTDQVALNDVHLRHIGIYAYRGHFLKQWPKLPHSKLEVAETLEQLRALESGAKINVQVVENAPPHGVDTREDYERVCECFENGKK